MTTEPAKCTVTETNSSDRHKRHITIVSETFPPEINGVANTLGRLCQGLIGLGHQVTVVRPRQPQERTGLVTNNRNNPCLREFTVHSLPLPGYTDLRLGITRPVTLKKLWKPDPPDCIYIATQGPLGLSATTAAKHLGIPVTSGFHTNFHNYSHYYGLGSLERFLCAYGRWFHNRTAMTLVPTRKTQATAQAMGISNTALWSRGVDCQQFTPHKRSASLRKRWGLTESDRAVLYVGRLAPEKNLQLAINSFNRIRRMHANVRFILVGDGPMRAQLEDQNPDFIFCGMQRGESLAQHYASGDLFLFPSKTDTFGNVVLEAMASGLGVVAFDDAAASEHIRHNDNGLKAPLDDDANFIKHALRLAGQPSLLHRVRTKSRLDALDLNWSSQINQFERLVCTPNIEAQHHAIDKQSIPTL